MTVRFGGQYSVAFFNRRNGLPVGADKRQNLATQYNILARERGWPLGPTFMHNDTLVLLTNDAEPGQPNGQDAAKRYLEALRDLGQKHAEDFDRLDFQGAPSSVLPKAYEEARRALQASFTENLKEKRLFI